MIPRQFTPDAALLAGRVILITGAGGGIGREAHVGVVVGREFHIGGKEAV